MGLRGREPKVRDGKGGLWLGFRVCHVLGIGFRV